MIAERDEQIAVARLHHAAADVQAARDGPALTEDRVHRDQARRPAVLLQLRVRDRDAAAALGGFGVAEVDRAIGCEIAAEHHVHEAGLALRVDLRHAGERRRQLAGARDDAHAAGPLGHQHAAVGQEGERPGMHQAAGERLDGESAGGGGKVCGAAHAPRVGGKARPPAPGSIACRSPSVARQRCRIVEGSDSPYRNRGMQHDRRKNLNRAAANERRGRAPHY